MSQIWQKIKTINSIGWLDHKQVKMKEKHHQLTGSNWSLQKTVNILEENIGRKSLQPGVVQEVLRNCHQNLTHKIK